MLRLVSRRFCNAVATKPAASAEPLQDHRMSRLSTGMKPAEIVSWLDQYIIGQAQAKRAVANAIRNRWRRQQLSPDMRSEIMPRNILMVGPTGVGKTEIARRLAKLTDAPFVKVEATKYTEVGFHGKDVDSIIKDLVDVSVKRQRAKLEAELRPQAEKEVEHALLVALIGPISNPQDQEQWLKHLRGGLLEDKTISIELPSTHASPSDDSFTFDPKGSFRFSMPSGRTEKRRLPIKQAREKLLQAQFDKLISDDLIISRGIQSAEQEGIVFIDEIDKICSKSGSSHGVDASGEGVQRDLLPIVEGCEVSCGKYGNIKTDHILFVCAGAFHSVKPSDMLAELQGRLPVRVGLQALTEQELVRVLTEPKMNILAQQKALMSTEGVTVEFGSETVSEIARVAAEINSQVENIGARRLHTVIEKLMEDISFDVGGKERTDASGESLVVSVTPEYVTKTVGDLLKKMDLYKFII